MLIDYAFVGDPSPAPRWYRRKEVSRIGALLVRRWPMLAPEEIELNVKKSELSGLEAQLADRELELATLSAELRRFESRYLDEVGRLYAQFDEICAVAARLLALRFPNHSQAQENAEVASARATNSKRDAEASRGLVKSTFEPSEELAKLFRKAAIKLHPDLTTDEHERVRRRRVMAEVNRLYENGDVESIRRILNEWEHSPDNVGGEGTVAELIRTIRKIAQVRQRLQNLDREFESVKSNDLYALFQRAEGVKAQGEDLLTILATDAKRKVDEAALQLETVKREVGIL